MSEVPAPSVPPAPPAEAPPPQTSNTTSTAAPKRTQSSTVPLDFALDEVKVHTGQVLTYYKFQGYGFITLTEKDVVPGDKAFVFWKNILSGDRYPSLAKGADVQFQLNKTIKNGVAQIAAVNVAALGGDAICLQEDVDAKKSFVGAQNLRYTGTLKFFIPKRGYGYIAIDDGFQYDKEGVPKEIRCETTEMNANGGQPTYLKDTAVEFGIWQTPKGAFKAYNVTLPGGVAKVI